MKTGQIWAKQLFDKTWVGVKVVSFDGSLAVTRSIKENHRVFHTFFVGCTPETSEFWKLIEDVP